MKGKKQGAAASKRHVPAKHTHGKSCYPSAVAMMYREGSIG